MNYQGFEFKTKKSLREWIGHNGVECRVRLKRNGEVLMFGCPVETNRNLDFWRVVGIWDEDKRRNSI